MVWYLQIQGFAESHYRNKHLFVKALQYSKKSLKLQFVQMFLKTNRQTNRVPEVPTGNYLFILWTVWTNQIWFMDILYLISCLLGICSIVLKVKLVQYLRMGIQIRKYIFQLRIWSFIWICKQISCEFRWQYLGFSVV